MQTLEPPVREDAFSCPPAYMATAGFYDHIKDTDRPDIQFYVDAARTAGSPVLELGCGTGRVVLPIARAGVEVTGVDASPEMLAVFREKAAQEERDVRDLIKLAPGDMRTFDLGARFSLITMPFRSFQHILTVPEQLAILTRVRHHLRPSASLVLDIFNPSIEALTDPRRRQEHTWGKPITLPDGRELRQFRRVISHDYIAQVQTYEFTYEITHPDGRVERLRDKLTMRYTFRYELEHLFYRAGFRSVEIYGGFERENVDPDHARDLVVIAGG